MGSIEVKDIKDHVTDAVAQLKASHKFGLVIVGVIIVGFVVASALLHGHGAGG